MDEHNLFTMAHPEYYEPIARVPISPEYVDELRALVPGDWAVGRSGVWVGANPPERDIPPQGFKIHVSSVPAQAARVMRLVVPELVARQVSFKVAADPRMLTLLNSKRYGRGGSGKFMTIYPPTVDEFRALIEALHQRTSGQELDGPYILSDRRYRDSRVLFYRYGGFQHLSALRADGSREHCVRDPEGNLVPDTRTPYFQLPAWAEDPFGGSGGVPDPVEPVLRGRYRIEGVLNFSNSGGVYEGTDLESGRRIVIKEARPFTNTWGGEGAFHDAVDMLHREHRVMTRLAHLDFVPDVFDLFTEWEHTFLVEERLPGGTFAAFWAHEDNIVAPFVRRGSRVEDSLPKLRDLTRQLIGMVGQVHEAGVILGDLSPNNVLIDPVTRRVTLIDFESAVLTEGDGEFMRFARQWMTPGFGHPDRRAREAMGFDDDLYAVGMLLYSAVVHVQSLFSLKPSAVPLFLDRFVALGFPPEWKLTVEALLRGDAAEALRLLDAWPDPSETDDEAEEVDPAAFAEEAALAAD